MRSSSADTVRVSPFFLDPVHTQEHPHTVLSCTVPASHLRSKTKEGCTNTSNRSASCPSIMRGGRPLQSKTLRAFARATKLRMTFRGYACTALEEKTSPGERKCDIQAGASSGSATVVVGHGYIPSTELHNFQLGRKSPPSLRC